MFRAADRIFREAFAKFLGIPDPRDVSRDAAMLVDRGFRTLITGVAMLRPNASAFNRPDCFVIDDLRCGAA